MRLRPAYIAALTLVFCGCTSQPPIPTAGMRLWLRADEGVVRQGGTVTRWKDQSGQGNDAIQSDAQRQPMLVRNALNGLPVLRFDGLDDRLGFTGSTRLSHFSLFIVMKIDSGASGPNPNYPIIMGDIPADGQVFYLLLRPTIAGYSSDTIYAGAGLSSGVLAFAPGSGVFGRWNYTSVKVDQTIWSARLRVNGADAQITPTANNMIMSVPLGSSGGEGAGGLGGNDVARIPPGRVVARCDIAEVIVYNVALPDSLRHSVEEYLSRKYRLPLANQGG